MKSPIIEVKNLSFGYDTQILKNISLDIKEGEFVSVVGPNGAGKSTFIKCLCNILKTENAIFIRSRKKESYSSKDMAKIISYVPQSVTREFHYTCREFVLMSRYPYTDSFSSLKKEDYEACERAMELTETSQFRDRLMDTLSGGERQKVLIASAVAQEAEVMLLDEPTSYLDPKHISEVMKCVKNVNEKTSVIMVTHELNTVFMSDRVIALRKGEIVSDTDPEVFFEKRVGDRVFDTEFVYFSDNGKKYIFPKI